MVVSVCPECDGRELQTTTNFVELYTQCASCGCIIDVINCDNAIDLIKDQEQEIEEISKRLSDIKDQLAQAPDKPEQNT